MLHISMVSPIPVHWRRFNKLGCNYTLNTEHYNFSTWRQRLKHNAYRGYPSSKAGNCNAHKCLFNLTNLMMCATVRSKSDSHLTNCQIISDDGNILSSMKSNVIEYTFAQHMTYITKFQGILTLTQWINLSINQSIILLMSIMHFETHPSYI